ncbi:MAG TPA: Ppx/GppA phosphatase family protein [Thermoanaerobaculia bacterium]|nr:Ppx/GppA phosphatase family protein [Thermoanaerobaculia bacterium]
MARKPRRLAAIDVGTNSIHMMIVECQGRACRVIDKEKEMVQLGEGSLGGAPLTSGAIERAVEALARMADIARKWNVDRLEAVATSAVREAPNRRAFVKAVEAASGIKLRVISGQAEASLIFRAVRSAVDFQGGTALCIDIGGGSVEIISGTESEVFFTASEPLGALRLTQRFFQNDPPLPEEIEKCRRHARKRLRKVLRAGVAPGFDFCIGTSGTITTLAELASSETPGEPVASGLRWLELSALEDLTSRLASISARERVEGFGLEPKRAATIVAGALVLTEFLRAAGVKRMRACSAALREGMIERLLEEKETATPRSSGGVRRRAIVDLAERSGVDKVHAAHVSRLALRIFDETREVHGLKAADREILEYSALLHEIGLHVSFQGYHKHTYYLIRHAGLRGFTDDQVALIANVARYHRKATPSEKHENFRELAPRHRKTVERAAAILRLADALDRGRKQAVRDIGVDGDGGRLRFRARPRADSSTEMAAAEKQARYFARVFERPTEVTLDRERS